MKTRKGRPRPDPGCSATDDDKFTVKIVTEFETHATYLFQISLLKNVSSFSMGTFLNS
jgi:hypothetical protein